MTSLKEKVTDVYDFDNRQGGENDVDYSYISELWGYCMVEMDSYFSA